MKPGLYEKLITLGLAEHLKALGLESVREGAGEKSHLRRYRDIFSTQ